MLSIRLRRAGSTKKPYFRVVVIEARSGARRQLRREPGHLQPAVEAGTGRYQQGAHRALAEEGRAPVGLSAHAAQQAPVARPVGRDRDGRAQ